MKKTTSFFAMGVFAAAAFSAAAQTTFVQSEQIFHPSHRTAPIAADFTNNGFMDILYGGQGDDFNRKPNEDGASGYWWQINQFLCLNQGDKTFKIDGCTSTWEEYQETDEEGNLLFDEEGNPKMNWQGTRIWPEHGLPGTRANVYGVLDYNNDGLLDVLLMGRSEWDVFDYGTYGDEYLYLFKNLGNGKFELVPEAVFPHMRQDAGDSAYHYAIATGDYDNDGYVDFAVSATGFTGYKDELGLDNVPGRICGIYRNQNGSGSFERMKIAETKGGVWTNEVKDEDGTVIVEKQEMKGEFLPVSGNIHLVDLNNDGWLDLVCDGWCDNNWDGIHKAGATSKIYLNQKGEKFVDVTPDIPTFEALRSSATSIADFDNDGYLDYFFTGWGDNGYGWAALLYYNTTDENCIYESNIQNAGLGVDGTENCRQVIRDFDGDGILDIYYAGAAGCKVYYGNYSGAFEKCEDNLPGYGSDGSAAIADFNGNGLSSIFFIAYGAGGQTLYLNEGEAVEAPEAPKNVAVTKENGNLTITWEYDEDAAIEANLAYNVFVEKANGEKYFLIPADEKTGMVKVSECREAALRPNIMEFTLNNYDGEARVGVQAISLATETASAFTFATTAGVESVAAEAANVGVKVAGDAVTVAGEGEVNIYNVTGQKVATGVAGKAITVEGHGVFVVATANGAVKIVK